MGVGILTSGGDAPGMNAAVRAVFRSLKMREPDREIVFFHDGFRGLLELTSDRHVSRSETRGIIHRGGTFLGSERVPELVMPGPDAPDREARVRAREALLSTATDNLCTLGISHLVVIGGDGSMRGGQVIADRVRRVAKRPFRAIGIPATIDNDIAGTDYTIGFDTALNNVVDAIRKIRDTVQSHKRAIILEVMGNTSGWLALQSAIAGGASVVAIPEIAASHDHDQILACLVRGAERAYRHFIIVQAEGVARLRGDGWATTLRRRIEESPDLLRVLGKPMEVRLNAIGHLARGGSPSALDNTLAGLLGAAAADMIQLGKPYGHDGSAIAADVDVTVGTRGPRPCVSPLADVLARSPRLVDEDSTLFRLSRSLMLRAEQPF